MHSNSRLLSASEIVYAPIWAAMNQTVLMVQMMMQTRKPSDWLGSIGRNHNTVDLAIMSTLVYATPFWLSNFVALPH